MKIYAFLSTAFVVSEAAISGSLAVTYANNQVTIKGALTGLPNSVLNAGIHVHAGEDCTNGGETTADAVNGHVGGHLFSNHIDGWAYPSPITYNTNAQGAATIDVKTKYFVLDKTKGTDAVPAVEDRCIVLHGLASNNKSPRAAIAKIVKANNAYSASIKKYPGPGNTLSTTPSGTLAVTLDGDNVVLKGSLTGLGKSMSGAGIHIHSGTDCSGGNDVSTDAKVNAVVGGHLYSKGDGFLTTKYSSNAQGAGSVHISTPANAYTLKNADATVKAPAVENHCIVIHDGGGARVGIGKIVCGGNGCSAQMGAYPEPVLSNAIQMFTAFSAVLIYSVLAF